MILLKIFNKACFYYKISSLFLRGKLVGANEYSKDYNAISKTYQNLWIKNMGKYSLEMMKEIDFKDGYSHLDLACGTGYLIGLALSFNKPSKTLGIDNSKLMLDIARSRIKLKSVEFNDSDIMDFILKAPDNSFDIVTCGWAFAYVNQNKLLKEIYRVLKPGGQIAIIVNRKGTLENVENSFLKIMQDYPFDINIVNNIGLKLPRSFKSLRKQFEKVGFEWKNGWDKEKSFSFKSGSLATKWVKQSGALAGTFSIMNIYNFDNLLAKALEEKYKINNNIKITHKFLVGIGKKC